MALEQADVDQINGLINTSLNGGIAKLKTEMTSSFQGMLKPFEGLGPALSTLTENLTTLQTKMNETPAPGTKDGKEGKGGKEGELSPEVALQIKNLTKQVEEQGKTLSTEKEARTKAEKAALDTAKESKLRNALNQFQFVNPEAAEDAYALISGQVTYDDNGALIAGGLPMEDFVKDFVPSKKAHLLAPVGKGGAGASGGSKTGAAGAFQMENIKTGMSVDDQKSAAGAIVRALTQ